MNRSRPTTTILALFLLSPVALAQESVTQFRLAAAPGNISDCINLDSSLSRVHTLTVKDGLVEVKSAGGVDDKMKLTRPGVYVTDFTLGGGRLDVVADLSGSPKSLTVTEKNRGCKWVATSP